MAISRSSSGLLLIENTSSAPMPVEDGLKAGAGVVLFHTAFELEPVKIVVELPGAKATEFTESEPLPPTPKAHELPPVTERNTPWPALPTSSTFGSFGSMAMSLISSEGHVPSCSGVQLVPSLVLLNSPTVWLPKACPPHTSTRVPSCTMSCMGLFGRPADLLDQLVPPFSETHTCPPPKAPPKQA